MMLKQWQLIHIDIDLYENKKKKMNSNDLGVCFATENKYFTGNLQWKVFVVNNEWGDYGGEKFQNLLERI